MRQTITFFKKCQQLKKHYFLESACSFYFGLIFGNLFGTFLNFLRNEIVWDGTVLLIIILFFEFFNYCIYKKNPIKGSFRCLILLKNFQIGILLGLFIDAFKVGS
uniref:Ycf20 n=1 Tax=Boodleopsis pusilla TaxID=381415 RepID=A0A386AZJ6_9CHLO|nr:hypothetical protein Ycf20 [Boodleopsis pusilla]AYC64868.1 hypothetical protein Ycf20 [Boodleopsis pusilla]